MGWPKPSDIQNIYPGLDILKQRISKVENMDQLRAFMTGIQQDIQIKDFYCGKEDSLDRIKKQVERLVSYLNIPESSPPKVQTGILNLENFMRGFTKEFLQQRIQVESSIISKINEFYWASKIISDRQLEILKGWLPKSYRCDLKLLYRGSVDGMSSLVFHQKCDGKGPTITLIKCKFEKALEPRILGGFLDDSCHSDVRWTSSKEAFLFSLSKQKSGSVKCSILDSNYAFYGHSQYGPAFGNGYDLHIEGGFKTGSVYPHSYSNAIALCNHNMNKFCVEEVEVFQVQ